MITERSPRATKRPPRSPKEEENTESQRKKGNAPKKNKQKQAPKKKSKRIFPGAAKSRLEAAKKPKKTQYKELNNQRNPKHKKQKQKIT